MRRLVAAAVAVLLLGGCGGDSSSENETSRSAEAAPEATATIQGCAPECLLPNITYPGKVPKGMYKTEYFFAGQMSLVFDRGWAVGEDSTGELAAWENRRPDFRVIFWEDVFPTRHKQGLKRVTGVPGTADDVLGWLRANPNLPSPHHAGARSVPTFPQP